MHNYYFLYLFVISYLRKNGCGAGIDQMQKLINPMFSKNWEILVLWLSVTSIEDSISKKSDCRIWKSISNIKDITEVLPIHLQIGEDLE